MRIIYLHGFASGPGSRKAQVFRTRFEDLGVAVSVPALDAGNFFGLTISGQYSLVEAEAKGEPVVLVGSSMGGYLAALYAARHPEVEKLVLLAPAFGFRDRWPQMLGEEKFAEWKRTGELSLFHYATGAEAKVGWGLAEDAMRWEAQPEFSQAALIFHGTKDLTVPISGSESYAAGHSNVRLERFEAGHELTEVIDEMWEMTVRFLGIG